MAESECAWVCDGKVIFCAPTSKRADSWKISRNLPVTACLDALLLYQRRLAPRQPEVREPNPVVDESFRKLLHTELIAKKRLVSVGCQTQISYSRTCKLDQEPWLNNTSVLCSIKTSSNSTALHCRPPHSIPPPLGNINTKPYDQRRSRAYPKQERETLPIILRLVDDRLDDIRPNHGRCAVGKTEQAKELRVHRSKLGQDGDHNRRRTMLSNPGGLSSAIIVCAKA